MDQRQISMKIVLLISIMICTANVTTGQISGSALIGAQLNTLQTAVPFLTIAPDGRSSGMGDVGAATAPDINSQHWNSGKYAFVEGKGGVAITYTPLITNLIPHIYHACLSGYYRINEENVVSSSFRYFSLGTLTFTGSSGTVTGQYNPIEFSVDAGYSRKFTDRFSGGVVLRYIRSDLTSGRNTANGQETHAGISFAGDLGLYYQNDIQVRKKDAQWAIGINISNIGTPISYTKDAEKTPIPTNLRLGSRFSYHIDDCSTVSFHGDLNKLLVPTPAVFCTDTATGEQMMVRGKEAPGSVVLGMVRSFYDAPGVLRADGTYNVASEEFHEVVLSMGAEYSYRNQFAIRSGYFHEHATKGNRKYFSVGVGLRLNLFLLDLSYLVPTNGQDSPLSNTYRLTLSSEFGRISD